MSAHATSKFRTQRAISPASSLVVSTLSSTTRIFLSLSPISDSRALTLASLSSMQSFFHSQSSVIASAASIASLFIECPTWTGELFQNEFTVLFESHFPGWRSTLPHLLLFEQSFWMLQETKTFLFLEQLPLWFKNGGRFPLSGVEKGWFFL